MQRHFESCTKARAFFVTAVGESIEFRNKIENIYRDFHQSLNETFNPTYP